MAVVGDQIEVSSKAGARSGVVTGVNGPMIAVRWSTGEETSFVPGPGVLSVVKRRGSRGTSQVRARTGKPSRASKSSKRKRTAASKRRVVAKNPTKTKTRAPVKRTGSPKRTATKKAGIKRATVKAAKRRNANVGTRGRPEATTKARVRARTVKAAKKPPVKKVAKKVGRPAKKRSAKRS
jgi:Domain of unknown function (DUF1918)